MRCPYPDCTRREKTEVVSGYVHRCVGCSRLALRCERGHCSVLNRPFCRFCRQCCDPISERQWAGSAADLWDTARRLQTELLPGRSVGDPEVMVDLSTLEKVYLPPKRLLEMRLLNGLLAVHQGGVYYALVHPFAECRLGQSIVEEDRVVWCAREFEQPKELCRPYPIGFVADRYAIFSSKLGATCVDLWSVKGWSKLGVRQGKLVENLRLGRFLLACSPIPLGTQARETLGLLIYSPTTKEYRWCVVDVAAAFTDSPTTTNIEARFATGTPIPLLCGAPVQILLPHPDLLTFSTSHGHWCWPIDDACEARVEKLVRTWPKDPSAQKSPTTLLDNEIADEESFRLTRQFQVLNKSAGVEFGVDWYFQAVADQATIWHKYTINVHRKADNSMICESLHPAELKYSQGQVHAVGMHLQDHHHHHHSLQDRLFVSGSQMLKEEGFKLVRGPQVAFLDRLDNVMGYQFLDPLLITISNETRSVGIRSVDTVLSPTNEMNKEEHRLHMDRSEHQCEITLEPIMCDPCVWNRWLFTLEQSEERLLLKRRIIAQNSKPTA